jgi:hypothetical protein
LFAAGRIARVHPKNLEKKMARFIKQHGDGDTAFRAGPRGSTSRVGLSVTEPQDDALPPEVITSERNRNRVWRAMSWILFANVLLFWLMTCVTAFSYATGP